MHWRAQAPGIGYVVLNTRALKDVMLLVAGNTWDCPFIRLVLLQTLSCGPVGTAGLDVLARHP